MALLINLLFITHKNPVGAGKNTVNKMDEKMIERLTAEGISEEDLQNPEKVKELAEKYEALNKEEVIPAGTKEDKILNDQLGRLAKNMAKYMSKSTKEPAEEAKPTLSELDVDNRVFAKTQGLTVKQLEILKEYSTLSKNVGKSYEEIYNSSAVQAELKDLQAEQDALEELDTNATEEKLMSTKNEIYDNYIKTGKTPDTEYEQRIIAEKGLADAGFGSY